MEYEADEAVWREDEAEKKREEDAVGLTGLDRARLQGRE